MFDKRDFRYIERDDEYRCPAGQRATRRFSSVEDGMTLNKYWSSACPKCPLKSKCTTGKISSHHALGTRGCAREDAATARAAAGCISRYVGSTVEHTFGTLKAWMGATHFLTKTLPRVSTEMSLHVLAYNMKRVLQILGAPTLIEAMTT